MNVQIGCQESITHQIENLCRYADAGEEEKAFQAKDDIFALIFNNEVKVGSDDSPVEPILTRLRDLSIELAQSGVDPRSSLKYNLLNKLFSDSILLSQSHHQSCTSRK